jgi:hypothetical protein
MKSEKLRRKPRILVNLAAVLVLEDGHKLPCRIVNLSIDGAGIKLNNADSLRVQRAAPTLATLLWNLVPSLPAESWPIQLTRSASKVVGGRFPRRSIEKRGEKILERLIHFHLK